MSPGTVEPLPLAQTGIEVIDKQRGKSISVKGVVGCDTANSGADPAVLIGLVRPDDPLVELREGIDHRYRVAPGPTETAHVTLDTTLHVSALDA